MVKGFKKESGRCNDGFTKLRDQQKVSRKNQVNAMMDLQNLRDLQNLLPEIVAVVFQQVIGGTMEL